MPQRRPRGQWPRRTSRLIEIGLVLLTAAASTAVIVDVTGPARPGLVLPFLIVGPGLAWAHWLRLKDPVVLAAVTVALSLSLDTLVACVMLYWEVWSPEGGFAVLTVVTVAGVAASAMGHHCPTPPSEGSP